MEVVPGHRQPDLHSILDQEVLSISVEAAPLGIGLAVILRLGLWRSRCLHPPATEVGIDLLRRRFVERHVILMAGGLFLIWRATTEIHDHVAGEAIRQLTAAGAAVRP